MKVEILATWPAGVCVIHEVAVTVDGRPPRKVLVLTDSHGRPARAEVERGEPPLTDEDAAEILAATPHTRLI